MKELNLMQMEKVEGGNWACFGGGIAFAVGVMTLNAGVAAMGAFMAMESCQMQ